MSIDSDSLSEEKSIFRPFTRESLQTIEQRIAEEHARQKELERKRAEGLVSIVMYSKFVQLFEPNTIGLGINILREKLGHKYQRVLRNRPQKRLY